MISIVQLELFWYQSLNKKVGRFRSVRPLIFNLRFIKFLINHH